MELKTKLFMYVKVSHFSLYLVPICRKLHCCSCSLHPYNIGNPIVEVVAQTGYKLVLPQQHIWLEAKLQGLILYSLELMIKEGLKHSLDGVCIYVWWVCLCLCVWEKWREKEKLREEDMTVKMDCRIAESRAVTSHQGVWPDINFGQLVPNTQTSEVHWKSLLLANQKQGACNLNPNRHSIIPITFIKEWPFSTWIYGVKKKKITKTNDF